MAYKKIIIAIGFILIGLFIVSCSFFPKNPLLKNDVPELYPIRQNNKNGYMNRKGEIVIQPQFEITLLFTEGLAMACINSTKCGYIDETGKFVINPQFERAYRFSEGLAAVVSEGRIGYIDKSGKYIINPQFTSSDSPAPESISTFSEGLAAVKIGDKYGYIDRTGKIVINPQFEIAFPFLDGLAAAKTGDKWGYIDKEGKIAINPQFDEALPFINGYAGVMVGNQFGYIDKTGKFVINPQFSWAMPFSDEGLAAVILDKKLGLIDREGTYVVNPQFELNPMGSLDIKRAFLFTSELGRLSFSEGLIPVQLGSDKRVAGYADKSGKLVINPRYREASPFYGGLALVVFENDEMAWIDKQGNAIWREKKEVPKPESNSSYSANTTYENSNTAINAANVAPDTDSEHSERTGRLTTDSNIRSDANKDAVSLGIQFKGAKFRILDETSFQLENGEFSTWYKISVSDYGCSVDTNLGCGKNSPNDSDEGWVNAKNVLLD